MNKTLLFLLLIFSFSLSAQSIKVRGTIKDTIGNPLEFANVIASIKSSGETESYGITNHEGRFQLDLPKGNSYVLRASFLGFQNSEKTIEVPTDAQNMQIDFVLKEQENQLDDVELVYEMPVTIKGDTIVYNADSFTNGDERKLGDVMKKLPGVEVNDEGEIQVEGKTVQKVMVDGKDFFDGDSKLATKNIPADAVDKVEVLRNYNEVNQMRGLGNDQDNVAINIKLKEGKKNFWFGEVTAGAGVAAGNDENGRYLAHPKLFYYSPKYSINIITDFNNIGEVPFTFRDYFKFTGGFRNFNRGGGTNFSIRESDLGFAIAQNDRAKAIEAKFVAGNFSYAVNEKLDLSGFAILSDNKTDIVNNSIRQYIQSGITENTNSENNQRNQLAMLKLSSTYKPNSNFQLDYDALVKTSKQSQDDATISIVGGSQNDISETKENQPFSINQNANAYFTLNDKNIFAAQLQHLYQNEDPFYQAVQDSIPFRGVFTQLDPSNPFNGNADTFDPLQPADRYNINQDKTVKTNKVDGKVDYYYVLNNVSNLNFTLGTTFSNQRFNSGIFQILDNGNRNTFEGDDFNNDVSYTFSDVFLGLHYKLKTGKFTITPGITLHNYNLRNEQLGSTSTNTDWRALPDLNVIFELKKSENLRFNYAVSSEYSDVNNYAQAYVFNNYNRLFRGNRALESSLSHVYNLTYFSFNLFNYTNIGANLNYTRKIDAIKTNTLLAGINQVSTPINFDSNFPDETFSVMGSFSKRIKRIQFKVNANLFLTKTNNTINTVIQESQSFTQNYMASVISNFKEFPNFEVGYQFMKNDYDNGGIEQTYFTNKPYVNINVRFLKDFELTGEWDFYNYTNDKKTIENEYSFLNANLYYQKGDSPWEFSVRATNLLNTKSLNNDSFSDQFNSTSQYFVMPRILMFVVKYDL
ncbi:carboxypeptidase-like regulatory domain-containing protein [Aequorivita viscosa]|uniref:CarboxypepD_reg-like domain-containing protein n=1 Tax=Aequorivita viscosa TaxID=797419 RepID=A0A1M6LUQ2_9FLAO|nr:carboxypeptidase-like regulatory domain-containing protein [Aequorivita viscosa]SDX25323.1 Outer membrane protein beta-barrel family protein [Aequorivita viscosa]SHJ74968.1 CarboxypepD_reg-like domain-containing protein [Aequorivita viscosa]